MEQMSPSQHHAVRGGVLPPPIASMRPLCSVPAKKCQALSSVSCERQASSQPLTLCTPKKIHVREMKVLCLPDTFFFFFFAITLLPPHHHFLGFCLFHRVCLPLMAKPEGKTHNLAKSFQSIYLPPTLMAYS